MTKVRRQKKSELNAIEKHHAQFRREAFLFLVGERDLQN